MTVVLRQATTKSGQLDELYRDLPTIRCKGKCANQCTIVPISDHELRRLAEYNPEPENIEQGKCVYLDHYTHRCTVHPVRPLLCRLYGIAEGLKCPHGCKPEPRYLTDAEADALITRAMEIGNDVNPPNVEYVRGQPGNKEKR